MYFLSGINKVKNFSNTVAGFKKMFFLKKLPNIFYQLSISVVILLEILGPIIILYSLQTDMYNKLAYFSSVGLAGFTVLATLIYHFPPTGSEYYAFMKNLTATGSLMLLSCLFL
tara:strand:- start:455 stop:796 length:342 start_codon:yes stop_codon:yes gene_type:complete